MPEMEKLEDQYSGCNMQEISSALVQAGAVWLDFPDRNQYCAYDASHLNADEAKRFSLSLAAILKSYLQR